MTNKQIIKMRNLKKILFFFCFSLFIVSCQKEYSFEKDKELGSNQWQFRLFPNFQTGTFQKGSILNKNLIMKGKCENMDHDFSITLTDPAGTYGIGTYKSTANQATFLYSKSGTPVYHSVSSREFNVRITLLTDQLLLGDFEGFVVDSTNKVVYLTQGKFNAVFSK